MSKAAAKHQTPPFTTSFGVYDEGEQLRSLYLRQVEGLDILATLAPLAHQRRLAVLSDQPPPAGAQLLRGGGWLCTVTQLEGLRAPVELVVFSADSSPEQVAESLPTNLMADPLRALPTELGAQLAASLSDDGNAVLYARDTRLLAPFLRCVVEGASQRLTADLPPPEIPDQALLDLLSPMRESAWCDLSFSAFGRYRLLTLRTIDGEDEGRCLNEQRWVAPVTGGGWRAGWSW